MIHNAAQLISLIDQLGFLPLLDMGIGDWSAEARVSPDCHYTYTDDGSFYWPLWEWKGDVIKESGCAYGKFFNGKAAFVSHKWWPDFCNWRRSVYPIPKENSLEEAILYTLSTRGSMVSRDLRRACGLTGGKLRGRFDSCVARLQSACRVLTEDFVYLKDRHGRDYGWGLSLLASAERLMGTASCHTSCSPQESHERLLAQMRHVLPRVPEKTLLKLLEIKR